MSKTEKQRFYPIRDAEDPSKVSLIPISEKVYQSIYPEIWRVQKQMRKLKRCICPKSKLWACDADCLVCKYSAIGNQVPIDTPIDDSGELTLEDTIADDAPSPETIALDHALLDALFKELEKLDSEDQRICKLLMNHSERESADILGMPRSTFKRHWVKIREKLQKRLKNWYE